MARSFVFHCGFKSRLGRHARFSARGVFIRPDAACGVLSGQKLGGIRPAAVHRRVADGGGAAEHGD